MSFETIRPFEGEPIRQRRDAEELELERDAQIIATIAEILRKRK